MLRFLKGIISFSLANRIYVSLGALALAIAGYIAYLDTPVVAFPDLTNTRITIITQWPGRSTQEIERFVTIPIEIQMNTVPKRVQVRSISLFGLSVVYVIFDDQVQDFEGRQYVINRLANVDFPDGVEPVLNPPQGPTDEIFRFTLQSKQFNARDMKSIMDWVIDRQIKSVPGVADLVSFGGQVKTYEISIDPQLLVRYDITIQDVFNAISKSNINVGGDVISHSQQAYVVRGIGLLTNISSIENIILDTYGGNPVFLKNVGKVSESNLPPLGYVGRDTIPSTVEGIVILRKGENPGPVIAALKEKIDELNDNILPGDLHIVTFYDRSNLIGFTIHTVTHNLLEGMLLVCLVVFFFLGDWRATLIASVTIPFSLLFAFFCLKMMGMSANLLSLGAIDFGIIADGTVVMTEGLFIMLDKKATALGMERFNKMLKFGLIRKEGRNLSRSVFFAALIILTALIPIFAFQRVEGKMFSPLAYTLGFALIGALICSLTVVPVLVNFILNKNVLEKHTFLTRGLHWVFERTLSWVDRNRTVSYTVAGAAWVIAITSAFTLGTEFLPHLNEGAIYIRAQMPYSTSLQQSIEIS
jgi:heavy metal efflux system protein